MIERDRRYNLIRRMYDAGDLKVFNDIFIYIPKTVVAEDLGKKGDRFNELMERVEGFTLQEIYKIGSLCGLSEREIYLLIEADYLKKKSKIEKNINNAEEKSSSP